MKLKGHSQSNHEAASEALGNRLKRYGPWRERFPGRRVAQSVGVRLLKLNDHLYLPRPLPTASPRAGEAPLTCVPALHRLSSLSIPSFSPLTHARSPRRPTITLSPQLAPAYPSKSYPPLHRGTYPTPASVFLARLTSVLFIALERRPPCPTHPSPRTSPRSRPCSRSRLSRPIGLSAGTPAGITSMLGTASRPDGPRRGPLATTLTLRPPSRVGRSASEGFLLACSSLKGPCC